MWPTRPSSNRRRSESTYSESCLFINLTNFTAISKILALGFFFVCACNICFIGSSTSAPHLSMLLTLLARRIPGNGNRPSYLKQNLKTHTLCNRQVTLEFWTHGMHIRHTLDPPAFACRCESYLRTPCHYRMCDKYLTMNLLQYNISFC